MPSPETRHGATAVAAGLLAALTAACGPTDPPHAGGPSSPPASGSASAPASPRATEPGTAETSSAPAATNSGASGPGGSETPVDNAGLPARTLLAKAYSELLAARSARIAYTSRSFTADVLVDTSGNCRGTSEDAGIRHEMIQQGDVAWVRVEDPSIWALELGPDAVGKLTGKYARGKPFDLTARMSGCREAADVLTGRHDAWDAENAVKGRTVELEGREVVPVRIPDGLRNLTVYVAARGKPLPVRIEQRGELTPRTWKMRDFGEPVAPHVPPADKTVDIGPLVPD